MGVDWKAREQEKFDSGEYTRLPWCSEEWYRAYSPAVDHYAHVSTDDPSKIAYTPDDRHGREDRQLRTRPGKYLRKYFPDLSPQQIQELAGRFAGANERNELKFAHTADDIEKVYLNGPRSCMSHDIGNFSSPVHPTRAYAAGDLAVAFIGDGDDITARAVCWPEKHVRSTIYGDAARLGPLLEEAGFGIDNQNFYGARLAKIPHDCSWVAPYMDGAYSVEIGVEFLVISKCGELSCDTTTGVIGGMACDSCGDTMPLDDSRSVGDATWCEGCFDDHAFYCGSCEECYHNDCANSVGDAVWCDDCTSTGAFCCKHCEEYHSDSDGTAVDGDTWCESCASNHATFCEHCEESSASDHIEIDGETWCSACWENDSFYCERCEEHHNGENGLHTVGGDTWCSECVKHYAFKCIDCGDHHELDALASDGNGEERCEECWQGYCERLGAMVACAPQLNLFGNAAYV